MTDDKHVVSSILKHQLHNRIQTGGSAKSNQVSPTQSNNICGRISLRAFSSCLPMMQALIQRGAGRAKAGRTDAWIRL
jgi:hypothetical protein